jgi:DNA (cytosine-5)-methyltransferase 1
MTTLYSDGEAFKVVDLFAGPGGLAEGFSAYRPNGAAAFDVQLSVEKEKSAFATLRLRSFFRQFGGNAPADYYQYLAGRKSFEEVKAAYSREWNAACNETLQLELGTAGAEKAIDPLLDRIRVEANGNAVLLGGPPCQAYSLVGRARNRGIADYKASEDHRHFLYREYIRIIERLRPAAFVMENVKGFLSSKIDGQRIFAQVLQDLTDAGDGYEIRQLVHGRRRGGHEFVIRAEDYGIPQRRHRVILFGLRRDLASSTVANSIYLEPAEAKATVADVLRPMPKLRSGLSRGNDDAATWLNAAVNAFAVAAQASFGEEDERLDRVAERLAEYKHKLELASAFPRASTQVAQVHSNSLATWLLDQNLIALPNHESRGHMASDLARYAFAAVFDEIIGRSPKASEFPAGLAPAHLNWHSGKFNDRFRVQSWGEPATTITSHISKDGHYFIHPDPIQCRALTVREAARLQTFPDNYYFEGNRTEQYVQVGNAVPPLLASQIADVVYRTLHSCTLRSSVIARQPAMATRAVV